MYVFAADYVRMIEITATDQRKDLFRLLERMAETGEVLRVSQKGRVMDLMARPAVDAAVKLTPEQRWERFLRKPERKTDLPVDFEDLEYGHWTWHGEVEHR
jgi:hypothetical protein